MKFPKPVIEIRKEFLGNLIDKTKINIIQDFIDGKQIKELLTVQKR